MNFSVLLFDSLFLHNLLKINFLIKKDVPPITDKKINYYGEFKHPVVSEVVQASLYVIY